MKIKMNDQGFTLVELVIAVALLTAVLGGIYYFFHFSMKSYNYIQDHYQAEFNARKAARGMAEDIRSANSVMINGTKHLALEILNSGMTLNVYTDDDDDGTLELVQYKIENRQLKIGKAELGSTPSSWSVLADNINNASASPAIQAFAIDGKQLNIKLEIMGDNSSLKEDPVSIVTSVSVRNKGAMN